MKKAVFLDRDGTLIQDINYLHDVKDVELLEGAADALKIIKKMGFLLIVVSNQSGVARGIMTYEEVVNVNDEINHILQREGVRIDDFFFCPHYKKGNIAEYSVDCECRKPKTGMAMEAKNKYGLDLSRCYMIGDKKSDMEFGRGFGAKKVILMNSRLNQELCDAGEDFRVNCMMEASRFIMQNEYNEGDYQ